MPITTFSPTNANDFGYCYPFILTKYKVFNLLPGFTLDNEGLQTVGKGAMQKNLKNSSDLHRKECFFLKERKVCRSYACLRLNDNLISAPFLFC